MAISRADIRLVRYVEYFCECGSVQTEQFSLKMTSMQLEQWLRMNGVVNGDRLLVNRRCAECLVGALTSVQGVV